MNTRTQRAHLLQRNEAISIFNLVPPRISIKSRVNRRRRQRWRQWSSFCGCCFFRSLVFGCSSTSRNIHFHSQFYLRIFFIFKISCERRFARLRHDFSVCWQWWCLLLCWFLKCISISFFSQLCSFHCSSVYFVVVFSPTRKSQCCALSVCDASRLEKSRIHVDGWELKREREKRIAHKS